MKQEYNKDRCEKVHDNINTAFEELSSNVTDLLVRYIKSDYDLSKNSLTFILKTTKTSTVPIISLNFSIRDNKHLARLPLGVVASNICYSKYMESITLIMYLKNSFRRVYELIPDTNSIKLQTGFYNADYMPTPTTGNNKIRIKFSVMGQVLRYENNLAANNRSALSESQIVMAQHGVVYNHETHMYAYVNGNSQTKEIEQRSYTKFLVNATHEEHFIPYIYRNRTNGAKKTQYGCRLAGVLLLFNDSRSIEQLSGTSLFKPYQLLIEKTNRFILNNGINLHDLDESDCFLIEQLAKSIDITKF